MNQDKNIGLTIKEIIKKRGISQKYLSIQTNTPETTMSGYLNGNRAMPFDAVCKIARVLKLDLNNLFDIPSEYVMNEQEFELISAFRHLDGIQQKELYLHILGILHVFDN